MVHFKSFRLKYFKVCSANVFLVLICLTINVKNNTGQHFENGNFGFQNQPKTNLISYDMNTNDLRNFYENPFQTSITNLTSIIGKTVHLNCSLFGSQKLPGMPSLNPTWLKADVVYNQLGYVSAFKTENIIATRKGIIVDMYRNKMKLQSISDKLQILRIEDVDVSDEGKYICREFNSQIDKLFFLNVYSSIKELDMKFYSASKYFREFFTPNRNDRQMKFNSDSSFESGSTISIKENDELMITCSVNSSKPAANISIWVVRDSFNKKRSVLSSNFPNRFVDEDYESKRLDIIDTHSIKNDDFTLKTIATAKLTVKRFDNHKMISCVAENPVLNEKWETKRALNVLYSPKCSHHQKTTYNTGINQTVEIECHMSEANPPYLDFKWRFSSFLNYDDKVKANGFVSRINVTPKSMNDFGEIVCIASNGLDSSECRIQLKLGGAPNPPYDCFYKENNKTIIIECKPGFDQGDPEVYFYLLKKKANGVLVEYARKRDSCSFLISNMILEEHLNEFYIYSSNKYGNNRDRASTLLIENKEFLLRNSDSSQSMSASNNRRTTIILIVFGSFLIICIFVCCLFSKCNNNSGSSSGSYKKSKEFQEDNLNRHHHHHHNQQHRHHNHHLNDHYNSEHRLNSLTRSNHVHYQEPYKYQSHFNSKSNMQLVDQNDDKINSSAASNTSSSYGSEYEDKYTRNINSISQDHQSNTKKSKSNGNLNANTVRSPSLYNNIQEMDMSPKSKQKTLERKKDSYDYSRSLIDETTETESDNYVEFNRTKIKPEHLASSQFTNDDIKNSLYSTHINTNKSNTNTIKSNGYKNSFNTLTFPTNTNVWYGNESDYSGISVDKPIVSIKYESNSLKKNVSNDKLMNADKRLNTKKSKVESNNQPTQNGKREAYKNVEKVILDWQSSNGFISNNETVSLEVDDDYDDGEEQHLNRNDNEKMLGILV